MSEKLLNNYESNNSIEQSNENTITSFDNTEKIIKDNYLRNESNEWARELAINQVNESNNLRESLENQVLN